MVNAGSRVALNLDCLGDGDFAAANERRQGFLRLAVTVLVQLVDVLVVETSEEARQRVTDRGDEIFAPVGEEQLHAGKVDQLGDDRGRSTELAGMGMEGPTVDEHVALPILLERHGTHQPGNCARSRKSDIEREVAHHHRLAGVQVEGDDLQVGLMRELILLDQVGHEGQEVDEAAAEHAQRVEHRRDERPPHERQTRLAELLEEDLPNLCGRVAVRVERRNDAADADTGVVAADDRLFFQEVEEAEKRNAPHAATA